MINQTAFTQTNPTASSPRNSPSLATQLTNINNELTKIEQSIQDGYYNDSNTVARVSTSSFTVLTDRTAYYTAGRRVRFNSAGTAAFATVASSSYNSGTGLTTVVIHETTVPNPLNTVDLSIQSKGYTNLALYSPTITTPTISGGTITKPTLAGRVLTSASYSPTAGGTATLDCAAADRHIINMPAGNITIALTNISTNQPILIEIVQDGTGSRTVTWFSGIDWSYDVVPTLTTTGGAKDVFGILCTGSGAYQGSTVGLGY